VNIENVVFHLGSFENASAVTLFYLAVVLEEGQVVDRGPDPQAETKFVVHLDGDRPHAMVCLIRVP
jgi:hypothetical protein